MKRVANILGYWLWIGFAGGTAVLLLIATPTEKFLSEHGLSRGRIDIVLAGLALAWVAGSFFAAYFLEQVLRTNLRRLTAHVMGMIISGLIFAIFLQAGAGLFGVFRQGVEEVSERFTFGPYPSAEACVKIKGEGHTAIVSLLNPIVPFEAVLLIRERKSAKASGLELIEIPMLPWVTENEAALNSLRELARNGKGRYYVHCYLGRHRADLARYVILETLGIAHGEAPKIVLPDAFERGAVVRVQNRFIIGPLPTKDEWFESVMRAGTRNVVCLLDPKNAEDKRWIDEERTTLENMGITLEILPARTAPEAAETAKKIKAMEGTVYIHSFRPDDKTARIEALLKS